MVLLYGSWGFNLPSKYHRWCFMEHQNTTDQNPTPSVHAEGGGFEMISSGLSASQMGSVLASPNDNLKPSEILSLQRLHGNQFVQRFLQRQGLNLPQTKQSFPSFKMVTPAERLQVSSPNANIQRQDGAGDSDTEGGARTIRMVMATLMHNEIGHTWIIFEHPNGDRETWGFYPTNLEGMGDSYTDPVPGHVMHPDPHHNDEPSSTFGYMINHEQYQRAIQYANNQEGRDYRLNRYNCAGFARGMLHAATGTRGPVSPFLGQANDTPLGVFGMTFGVYLRRLIGL